MRFISICTTISMVLSSKCHNLVDIQLICPQIEVDLGYASSKKFTGKPIYDYACILVHKRVAHVLAAIQEELE